jgi:hypothetical protein
MNDSTEPIILLSSKAEDFYCNYHLILERASVRALEGYVTGKQILPSEAEVEELNMPIEHFLKQQLKTEQSKAEEALEARLREKIYRNPLFAYSLAVPIVAVDDQNPTEQELDNSRQVILYHADTYRQYALSINEDLEAPGTLARDRQ